MILPRLGTHGAPRDIGGHVTAEHLIAPLTDAQKQSILRGSDVFRQVGASAQPFRLLMMFSVMLWTRITSGSVGFGASGRKRAQSVVAQLNKILFNAGAVGLLPT